MKRRRRSFLFPYQEGASWLIKDVELHALCEGVAFFVTDADVTVLAVLAVGAAFHAGIFLFGRGVSWSGH
jgi:hypothetical protein